MIEVSIDTSAATPPFEQLRSQLHAAIVAGISASGTRLPPIRQLAGDLGIAPNTVARAYRELEADGLIEGHGRRGTVVTGDASTSSSGLAQAARQYLDEAKRLGLDVGEAQAVLRMLG